MKNRYMGTSEECQAVANHYLDREHKFKSLMVSPLYPNRNSNTVFRIYIDVEFTGDLSTILGGGADG